LTETQRAAARRIEKRLNMKINFEFKDKPLSEVAQFLHHLMLESFILDPVARKAGLIDPKIPLTASVKQVPLGEALQKLLDPIGMTYTIRDEVVVLTMKPKAKPGK